MKRIPPAINARRSIANDFHQWAAILTARKPQRRWCGPVTSADRKRSAQSVLEVLTAGGPAWIARQEAEDEDADEKEDDRVNGDLEGEHGDRPASVRATSSYGAQQRYQRVGPPAGQAIGLD